MDPFAILVRGLSYSVNQAEILKGIDLEIKKGGFTGIIGPNGAGKTTLLKCINGILKAEGQVMINQQELQALSSKAIAREAAFMHQNTVVTFPFPSMEVVLMGRYPHVKRFRRESREDYSITMKNMEYTDTIQFKDKPITQLSGGERQRVLFAKVLAQQTEILLLDEPTASLDITHQEQIFKYARELCDTGRTVVAAVHDLKIAARYCSCLILMKKGEIIAQGAPEEVLTGANLSKAFGVNALVYRNKITGLLDFHIHELQSEKIKSKAHIIGGGGSASGVIRHLFESGYEITAGVFSPGDSDVQCAEVFGIRPLLGTPFSDISDEAFEEMVEHVKAADITVLCNMPFGRQNLRSLEAAAYAKRLIIIEDDTPEMRDFSDGKALALYHGIRGTAIVTTSARMHEVL